jgi:hypothetical protein
MRPVVATYLTVALLGMLVTAVPNVPKFISARKTVRRLFKTRRAMIRSVASDATLRRLTGRRVIY